MNPIYEKQIQHYNFFKIKMQLKIYNPKRSISQWFHFICSPAPKQFKKRFKKENNQFPNNPIYLWYIHVLHNLTIYLRTDNELKISQEGNKNNRARNRCMHRDSAMQLEQKREREREIRFPLDPDIGSIRGINFPRLHRVTRRFDERTFPAIPTSAGAYRSRRKNEQDRNWIGGTSSPTGHFEYTLPKTLRVSSRYIHGKCCCLRVSVGESM